MLAFVEWIGVIVIYLHNEMLVHVLTLGFCLVTAGMNGCPRIVCSNTMRPMCSDRRRWSNNIKHNRIRTRKVGIFDGNVHC